MSQHYYCPNYRHRLCTETTCTHGNTPSYSLFACFAGLVSRHHGLFSQCQDPCGQPNHIQIQFLPPLYTARAVGVLGELINADILAVTVDLAALLYDSDLGILGYAFGMEEVLSGSVEVISLRVNYASIQVVA